MRTPTPAPSHSPDYHLPLEDAEDLSDVSEAIRRGRVGYVESAKEVTGMLRPRGDDGSGSSDEVQDKKGRRQVLGQQLGRRETSTAIDSVVRVIAGIRNHLLWRTRESSASPDGKARRQVSAWNVSG